MIKVHDLTPAVYYNESRDFQLLGRLYDVVINSVKTNADLLYSLPYSNNSPEEITDLLALTLGLQSKHNYNLRQLEAICSIFSYILRNKGTDTAILMACRAILRAEGLNSKVYLEHDPDDYFSLTIYITKQLVDISLLRDILNYIIPAGMSCNLIQELSFEIGAGSTNFTSNDSINIYAHKHEQVLSKVPRLDEQNAAAIPIKDFEGTNANGAVVKFKKRIE